MPELCRICRREEATLSFEHVPPRSALNAEPTTVYGLADWLARGDDGGVAGGRIEQRGAGGHTLCERCNNNTGSWYANELARAARAGAKLLVEAPLAEFDRQLDHQWARVGIQQTEDGPYPLRFIKQIVAMMLATSPPELSLTHPELGDFVLDRQRIGLPDTFRFYLGLFAGPMARTTGVAHSLNLETGVAVTLVEVAWPPFAYVMTIDTAFDAVETADITGCADVGYNQRADLELDLLVGFGHTPYPADYRTKAMLERDIARNP